MTEHAACMYLRGLDHGSKVDAALGLPIGPVSLFPGTPSHP